MKTAESRPAPSTFRCRLCSDGDPSAPSAGTMPRQQPMDCMPRHGKWRWDHRCDAIRSGKLPLQIQEIPCKVTMPPGHDGQPPTTGASVSQPCQSVWWERHV